MNYMDEFDPDWVGDPKISTLKRVAFEAKNDIISLKATLAIETKERLNTDQIALDELILLRTHIARIRRENNISNLYFQDKITKEEAKRLWDLFHSPDQENHRVAEAAIEELLKK